MRIVLYKDNLATGRGADKAICSLAGELAHRNHHVAVATMTDRRAFSFHIDPRVEVAKISRTEIRKFVIGFDVCIAAGPNEILDLTECGSVRPPVKTIVELLVCPRGFFKWRHPIRNMRLRKALGLADAVQVQVSGYGAYIEPYIDRRKIAVIGNWADIIPPSDEKSDSNIIVYPAAINEKKNQMLLIRAFALIANDFPGWSLHLYGKQRPRYGSKCMRLAARIGLEGRIKFFDFTNDLPSVYSSASFMAYPSLIEGFPLAMIEGMHYRLPVVAMDCLPGVHDMIFDGATGIITRPTVKAYSEGLRRLMADAKLRRQMGEEARRFVSEQFTRERILDKWDMLLDKVVAWPSATGG